MAFSDGAAVLAQMAAKCSGKRLDWAIVVCFCHYGFFGYDAGA
jgi:hypothetical protein